MDFAPYQDAAPETTRALSPPPPSSPRRPLSPSSSPRASLTQARNIDALSAGNPQTGPNKLPSPSAFEDRDRGYFGGAARGGGAGGAGGINGGSESWGVGSGRTESGRVDVDVFQTGLGIRLDWEACAAYVLLPPAGAVFLLIVEHKSDYVRFHAWQSSLLFSFLFIVHIIFAWSSIISWLLLDCDLLLIAWLTFRAYRDADTLDRCEVPFFGRLASSILDDE